MKSLILDWYLPLTIPEFSFISTGSNKLPCPESSVEKPQALSNRRNFTA